MYPALTVAAELAAGRDDVLFVGTPKGLEARLVAETGLRFRALEARGFDRSRPWTLVTSSVLIAVSTIKALALLGAEKPDVVVGFGGYVSIPVGIAAALRGIPLVLHEQNSVPGLANKVLSRRAWGVGVTYEESCSELKHPQRAVVTGNPVRPAVLGASGAAGREALSLAPGSLVLLVFGGSRGARHLNSAVLALRDRLLAIDGLEIVHVAGRAEVATVRDALAAAGGDGDGRWRVLDYLDDMGAALAAADLVVARAGATSIAEITALGRPALLVPYPYATDDHQTKNAATAVAHGAAVLVSDAELDGDRFATELLGLLSDPSKRASMASASRALGRPDAARRVADLARSAAAGDAIPHLSDDSTEA